MNNGIEVKPCPFCGGMNLYYAAGRFYSVECADCGGRVVGAYRTAEEAAEAWNTRKGETFTKAEAVWILNLLVSEYTIDPLCESVITKCEKILGAKD